MGRPLKLHATMEEAFEWNPYLTKVHIHLVSPDKAWALTKAYRRDFLESEFDVLWKAMGEELRAGIRRDREEVAGTAGG